MDAVIERGAPGRMLVSITPHDSTNFTNGVCRSIFVGGAGNIAVVPPEGSAVTLVGCLAGTVIPVQAIRVNSTGTTATSLVAIY
jgi:hypothetical protein